MKACILHGVGRLIYGDAPDPAPGPGEALLKIKASGVCGSDIARVFSKGTYSFPMIPGHEFAGEIVAVGPDACDGDGAGKTTGDIGGAGKTTGDISGAGKTIVDIGGAWQAAGDIGGVGQAAGGGLIGKRAAVFPLLPCRRCDMCETGLYEMCRNYSYFGSRCDGGFAEYIAVPIWNLVICNGPKGADKKGAEPQSFGPQGAGTKGAGPQGFGRQGADKKGAGPQSFGPQGVGLTYEELAMAEPAAVSLHALGRAGVEPGDVVAIFGAGAIGLMLAAFAKASGADKIILIDIDEKKLEFARGLGYRYALNNASGSWRDDLADITGGRGADLAVEGAGAAAAAEGCFLAARPGGRVVLMGNPAGDMPLRQDAYWQILRKQLTVCGTWNSSYNQARNDWRTALDAIAAGRVDVKPLITHKFPLSKCGEAFALLRDKNEFSCRVMFTTD